MDEEYPESPASPPPVTTSKAKRSSQAAARRLSRASTVGGGGLPLEELVWRKEQRAPDDQWEQVEEGGTPNCCWEEPASWCWPVKSEADRRKVWRGQSSQSSLEVRQHCR